MATFLIGDGFTQGFIASQGLQAAIPCRMHQLLPAYSLVQYIPTSGDVLPPAPLWSRTHFPFVIKEWESFGGANVWEFFKHIAQNQVNLDPKRSWAFTTESPAYQLRAYLWHYFRWVSETIRKAPIEWDKWNWISSLREILQSFNAYCVSFNYDDLFEFAAMRALGMPSYCPVENAHWQIRTTPLGAPVVIKPHGSYTFRNESAMLSGMVNVRANPWMHKIELSNNFDAVMSKTKVDYNVTEFPSLPDLVPPGHSGDHLAHPFAETRRVSRLVLSSSDVVIAVGLSGDEPDTLEVTEMLSGLRHNALRIHVGLDKDWEKPIGKILSKNARRYVFVNAKDAASVAEIAFRRCKG